MEGRRETTIKSWECVRAWERLETVSFVRWGVNPFFSIYISEI